MTNSAVESVFLKVSSIGSSRCVSYLRSLSVFGRFVGGCSRNQVWATSLLWPESPTVSNTIQAMGHCFRNTNTLDTLETVSTITKVSYTHNRTI